MSTHPGVSFVWSLRSTASSTMCISGKKLREYFIKINTRHICNVANEVSIPKVVLSLTASYTVCSPSHREAQSSVCCQDSTLKPLVIPLYVILCPVICFEGSSLCKHDVGALSWLNAETVERVPTPLFGRLVRCSAHGPFFARLMKLR